MNRRFHVPHETLPFGENGVASAIKIDEVGAGAQAKRGATASSIFVAGARAEPLAKPLTFPIPTKAGSKD